VNAAFMPARTLFDCLSRDPAVAEACSLQRGIGCQAGLVVTLPMVCLPNTVPHQRFGFGFLGCLMEASKPLLDDPFCLVQISCDPPL